uniref:Uncharacterized protein n=1 Tax=Oryza nivara TaxID=4536 RepID=A0A0E0GVL2_ORYNI
MAERFPPFRRQRVQATGGLRAPGIGGAERRGRRQRRRESWRRTGDGDRWRASRRRWQIGEAEDGATADREGSADGGAVSGVARAGAEFVRGAGARERETGRAARGRGRTGTAIEINSVKSERLRSIPPPTSLNRGAPLPSLSLSRSPTRTCASAASPIPLPHALTPETAPPSALPSPTASPICPARRQGCRLAAVYIAAHSVVIESVLGQESRRRRCPLRRSVPHRHRSPLPARPPPTPRRKPFCRQVSANAFHTELLLAATDPCCQVAADAFRTELLLAAPPRRRR